MIRGMATVKGCGYGEWRGFSEGSVSILKTVHRSDNPMKLCVC